MVDDRYLFGVENQRERAVGQPALAYCIGLIRSNIKMLTTDWKNNQIINK